MNRRVLKEVVIDSHFEEKHSESVNDAIILALVESLNGSEFEAESVSADGFEYYVEDPRYLDRKPYRLVWLLHPKEDYIGIINCFRRSPKRSPRKAQGVRK